MQKKMLLVVTLLGACMAGWVTSRGIGQAEAAGQQEAPAPQTPPRPPEYGKEQQGEAKSSPAIPQEYFPPVNMPANLGQRVQPKSIDLPTPSFVNRPNSGA